MLYLEVAVAIYILFMLMYLLLNYRGYIEVREPSALPESPPPLSVVVATCNDCIAIRNLLESLGRQDYPSLEILVMDESPTHETREIVQELSREYPNLRFERVGRPETDWSRRTFALHRGAIQARGQWLLFLGANVVLQPSCVSRTLAYALQEKIDCLSLMPGHHMRGFAEKLILPIVFGWFGTRFSIGKVNDPESTQAVGVSQFMLVRKMAYQATGGFEKVRAEILEDSALAREVKSLGLHYRLVGGKHLMTSRVYGGWREIWENCSRLFVGELGSSPLSLLWTFLVIGVTGIAPFASVLWCAYLGFDQVNPYLLALTVGQCLLVLSARLVLDYALGIGPFYAFLHPIGSIVTLAILATSVTKVAAGRIETVEGRVSSEL